MQGLNQSLDQDNSNKGNDEENYTDNLYDSDEVGSARASINFNFIQPGNGFLTLQNT